MFDTLKRYKTTLIILVLLVAGFFVYQQFFAGVDIPIFSQKAASEDAIAAGAEIVTALQELKILEVNTTFFDNAVFRSLIDFTKTIEPEAVGRQNPFELIGNGVDMQGMTAYPRNPFEEEVDVLPDGDTSEDEDADTQTQTEFETAP